MSLDTCCWICMGSGEVERCGPCEYCMGTGLEPIRTTELNRSAEALESAVKAISEVR